MYTRWTQHLTTDEDKEAFKKKIYSAKEVLDQIKVMLEEDLNALDRTEMDQRIYQIPNWDYVQAHKNGNRQVLTLLRNLVDLDQQKGSIHDHKSTGTN
jgi:hypothetical protein